MPPNSGPVSTTRSALEPPTGAKLQDENLGSEIVHFFAGKNVLITGGTGYLGRVLLHKLLSYCPDIGDLYLLMRQKKGVSQEKRLEELKGHFLFQDIEKRIPGQLDKMKVVQGDVQEIGLGMTDQDRETVKQEVNIVFHSAATVKFDEELSRAASMNVRGTRELMDLAKQMEKLISFVHVSTCYTHCHIENQVFQEKINPPEKFSVKEVLDMCGETINEEQTKKVIGDRPNTYSFTKAITEQMIKEDCGDLPISIVRPSIVVGAVSEPLPGWVDNINGPTSVGVFISQGVLKCIYNKPNKVADIIPVDIVINLMCAVAFKTAGQYNKKTGKRPSEIPVYNCNSGSDNPMTWGQLWTWWTEACNRWPSDTAVMPPRLTCHSSKTQDNMVHIFLNLIPAYILDGLTRLGGGTPKVVRRLSRFKIGLLALEWFANRQWVWRNDNVAALDKELNGADRKYFNFRVHGIDWREYVDNYYWVLRTHVLKNKPETVDTTRRKLDRQIFAFNVGWGAAACAASYYVALNIAQLF